MEGGVRSHCGALIPRNLCARNHALHLVAGVRRGGAPHGGAGPKAADFELKLERGPAEDDGLLCPDPRSNGDAAGDGSVAGVD